MKPLKFDLDLWLAHLCFFGLPLLAIGLTGFGAYQMAAASGNSPWLIVPLGIIGGSLLLGLGIAASGTDMSDFAVSSIVVIVVSIPFISVGTRGREIAHRRAAIKQMQQEHGAIYPQSKWKGAQRLR